MTNEELGLSKSQKAYIEDNGLNDFISGRVSEEHKERYIVKTPEGEYDAELIGNLRYSATDRSDLPAVGDWVAISEYDDNKALIHAIYPRYSSIERQAVGKHGETQIIASNIDVGCIMLSVNRDFSLNRLERYLTLCNASKVDPIIILSKTDLIADAELQDLLLQIKERINDVVVLPLSNLSYQGMDEVKALFEKGKTYCLLGSSGVGKSTLLNRLIGKEMMVTGEISESVDRGKHVTSHRELIVLENGAILIDNPGMREVGIADAGVGLEMTFEAILSLADDCKYNDCTHMSEKGCAILEALENDEIDAEAYENYQRMQRERAHFESSAEERKAKDKNLGKLIKNFKKQGRNPKF